MEDFKAGRFQQHYLYRSFQPAPINHAWAWRSPEVNVLLSEANHALGKVNAFGRFLPDIKPYVLMHLAKEAKQSSRIEGTQTHIETLFSPEEVVETERRDDRQEVLNYIEAMTNALAALGPLPLSNRLLRDAHSTLLAGVRGASKNPGAFRTSQNWIGGSGPSDAAFVPPHAEEVPELMSDLERFWHNKQIAVPALIRAAISHYQFETIHPFLDGNGRIGRLLIILQLKSDGMLDSPCLYLSHFFERRRQSYYDALMGVRLRNELVHWVKFFLNGVIDTSNAALQTFESLFALRQELEAKVRGFGNASRNAGRLLDLLYVAPVVRSADVAARLEVSTTTALKLLDRFTAEGILEEKTGRPRNQLFAFRRYIGLFEGPDER